jgi:hypothetical protein
VHITQSSRVNTKDQQVLSFEREIDRSTGHLSWSKVKLPNQVEAWAMSPSKYVEEAVANVEDYLQQEYDG